MPVEGVAEVAQFLGHHSQHQPDIIRMMMCGRSARELVLVSDDLHPRRPIGETLGEHPLDERAEALCQVVDGPADDLTRIDSHAISPCARCESAVVSEPRRS